MTDILGLEGGLPACPGRTWFEALVEGWHDQGLMRVHMAGLHERDLQRARQRPVVAVTVPAATGPLQFLADPENRTMVFTVSKPAAVPGADDDRSTYAPAPWLPATPLEEAPTMALEAVPSFALDDTAVEEAVEA